MRRITLWVLLFTAVSSLCAAQQSNEEYVSKMEKEHATDEPVASLASRVDPEIEIVALDATYAGIDGMNQ